MQADFKGASHPALAGVGWETPEGSSFGSFCRVFGTLLRGCPRLDLLFGLGALASPGPGSCLGLGLLLSQDSPTSTCCFGPGVGVGVGPSLFPFLRLPQSDVTLLVCACHQGPHLHDRRATEAKNKVWGRLGLRPTVCRGGRDELWGRGTCLCPGPTSKPCIPSLALPLLGNGRVPGRGLLFPRRQMAGARDRDVFDPFFVPATVWLRENQTVCVPGIVTGQENPGGTEHRNHCFNLRH